MSLFGKNTRDTEADAQGGGAPAEEATRPRPQSAPRGRDMPAAPPQRPADRQARNGDHMANIGKSITIKGDLTGDEDLQIEGTVDGRIDLPNNELTVGAEGKVRAEIHAKAVIVVGHVTGNVSGVDRIEIQASGRVDGDVKSPKLVVQEGAVLNGAIEMGNVTTGAAGTSRPAPAPPKAATGGAAA